MASTDRPAADRVVLVIPAFNEARRIGRTLTRIDSFAASAGYGIHVILVDDGSRDGTVAAVAAEKFGRVSVEVLVNEGNRGKGYSVKRGILHGADQQGVSCVAFSDADLSTPIAELDHLLEELRRGADVAIGSRVLAESHVEPAQPWHRRALGSFFRAIRRMILLRDIRDTQCGFKAFAPKAAAAIFQRCQVDGFAFDCEVLAAARALGYTIKEVGVTWRNDNRSTLRVFRHALGVGRDLLRVRARFGPQHTPRSKVGGAGRAERVM